MKQLLSVVLSACLGAGSLAQSAVAAARVTHVRSAAPIGVPVYLNSLREKPLSTNSTLLRTNVTAPLLKPVSHPPGGPELRDFVYGTPQETVAVFSPSLRSIPLEGGFFASVTGVPLQEVSPLKPRERLASTVGQQSFRPGLRRKLQVVNAMAVSATLDIASQRSLAGRFFDGMQQTPFLPDSQGRGRRGYLSHSPARDSTEPADEGIPDFSRLVRGGEIFSRLVRLGQRKETVKTRFSNDKFDGPPKLESPNIFPLRRNFFPYFKQQIGYGLKWGIHLFAIGTILDLAIRPLLNVLPWVLGLSPRILNIAGRAELLASIGPDGIQSAINNNPLQFLFFSMPTTVIWEEFYYRILLFGMPFLALTTLKPFSIVVARALSALPSLFGLRTAGQAALFIFPPMLSRSAYSIAAIFSALVFAQAHFIFWGFSPFNFIYFGVLALALSGVAYRSRGPIAPIVAHYIFNLILIGVSVVLPQHVLPQTATTVVLLAGLLAIIISWYNYRSYRKDKAAAIEEATGEKRSNKRRALGLLSLLIIPLLVFSAAHLNSMGAAHLDSAAQAQTTRPQLVNHAAAAAQPLVKQASTLSKEEIAARAKPATVQVVNPMGGNGSGFVISADGLVFTNAHVVQVAQTPLSIRLIRRVTHKFPKWLLSFIDPLNLSGHAGESQRISPFHVPGVQLNFADGRQGFALVVGYNPDKDIALLQLPPTPAGWKHLDLGDSSKMSEGQRVLAAGHPYGMPFSVSDGIISGLPLENMTGLPSQVRHDAAINPGNSGGPLLGDGALVLGMNSALWSVSGGFDGIGFAIPASDLQAALDQYQKVGNISTPWIGAIFAPHVPEHPQYGAWVEAVLPDSPAAKAGLQRGDIILVADGQRLSRNPDESFHQLEAIINKHAPNDTIELLVAGVEGAKTLNVQLDTKYPTLQVIKIIIIPVP